MCLLPLGEPLDKTIIALHSRKDRCVVPSKIHCVDIGAGAKQKFDDLSPVKQGAHHERGLSRSVAQVRVRTGGEQLVGDGQMSFESDPHQRAAACRRAVRIGAAIQQQRGGLFETMIGREDQGGVPLRTDTLDIGNRLQQDRYHVVAPQPGSVEQQFLHPFGRRERRQWTRTLELDRLSEVIGCTSVRVSCKGITPTKPILLDIVLLNDRRAR